MTLKKNYNLILLLISFFVINTIIYASPFIIIINIYNINIPMYNIYYMVFVVSMLLEILKKSIGYIPIYWAFISLFLFFLYITNINIYILSWDNLKDYIIDVKNFKISINYSVDIKTKYYYYEIDSLLYSLSIDAAEMEKIKILFTTDKNFNVSQLSLEHIRFLIVWQHNVVQKILTMDYEYITYRSYPRYVAFFIILGYTLLVTKLLLYQVPTFILVNFMEYKALYVIDHLFASSPLYFNMTAIEYVNFCKACIPSLMAKYSALKIILWP